MPLALSCRAVQRDHRSQPIAAGRRQDLASGHRTPGLLAASLFVGAATTDDKAPDLSLFIDMFRYINGEPPCIGDGKVSR